MNIDIKNVLLISALALSGVAHAEAVSVSIDKHPEWSVVNMVNKSYRTLTVTLNIASCVNIKADSCGNKLWTGTLGPGGRAGKSIYSEDSTLPYSFTATIEAR